MQYKTVNNNDRYNIRLPLTEVFYVNVIPLLLIINRPIPFPLPIIKCQHTFNFSLSQDSAVVISTHNSSLQVTGDAVKFHVCKTTRRHTMILHGIEQQKVTRFQRYS